MNARNESMRRREMGGGDRMDDGGVGEQIKVQRRVTEKKVKPFNCPVPRGKNERG